MTNGVIKKIKNFTKTKAQCDIDIKRELIPYDSFIGSQDFDKTIYDLNSQIELLLSQADNLDYIVTIASGIARGLLDILWLESLI